jgi:HEAT repeat protein
VILALETDRDYARDVLDELITHRDVEVRAWATDRAAAVLGEDAVPLLLRATKDRDPDVRDVGIERLLEVDPKAAEAIVPRLRRKLRGPEFYDAVSAMWALAQLRYSNAIDDIREAGRAGRQAGKTFQGITADVVADLLEGRDMQLVASLEAHDHDRTSALAVAASLIGTPEALAALHKCAESAPDEDCRLACKERLRKVETRG